jgi:hypothetical protein
MNYCFILKKVVKKKKERIKILYNIKKGNFTTQCIMTRGRGNAPHLPNFWISLDQLMI